MCYPQYTNYDGRDLLNKIGKRSVFASYMSLHTDTIDRATNYTILVHNIHKDMQPNLIHWVDGKFISTRLEIGGIYKFRANRRHGLFPDDLAELLITTQSVKASNLLNKRLDNKTKYPCIEFNFI